MAKIAIVYHSSTGRTKRQAEAVSEGAGQNATEVILLNTAEAAERIDELDTCDAIIFGCPTFMGNISADMKKFQEIAAAKWFSLAWKDKIAGAFTTSSSFSGDKLNTLIGFMINSMQHAMIYVGTAQLPAENEPDSFQSLTGPSIDAYNRVGSFAGAMASTFQVPAPQAPGEGDLKTAEAYGLRIATITQQFVRGRS